MPVKKSLVQANEESVTSAGRIRKSLLQSLVVERIFVAVAVDEIQILKN
jgi:hypothetical protein